MNFAPLELDDATVAFLDDVHAFLDEHLTEAVHEEEWRTGAGHNVEFHRALGRQGWVVPTWSVDQGGAGCSALQDVLLERELAARHAPTITKGTTRLVLSAVMSHGGADLKAEVLPGVASGEICFCLGYTEPDTGSDLAAVRTKAERDGNEWVINGQKMFTTGAQNCRYAFLVTRTNSEVPKHRGITMFLCPLDDAVFFDDVRIDDRYRLGDVDEGWGVLLGPLSTEHGMGEGSGPVIEARGGMYGRATIDALRVAIEWAEKPDPDGNRPIDDRTVRRRLARVALDLEAMSLAPGPIGRIVSAEYLIRSARDLIDLVGPVGLLPNGAPGAIGGGWLEYSHRFAQGTATYGGTTEVHRNIIAERMLGLPRSSPR
jgi:alkylation response protein AidB-like acyl-CoA dehydrogenase